MTADLLIRPAGAGDEEGIAAVHWAARRLAYRDLLPRENLDGRTVQVLAAEWAEILSRHDGSQTMLAEDRARRTLAFVTGGPVRERRRPVMGDLSGVTAEISLLYVLPERMRAGLGRRLFGCSVERLMLFGHASLLVWGYRGNPFLGLYERLGGIPAAESDWEVAGHLYPTRAYVWRDLEALVAACARPPR